MRLKAFFLKPLVFFSVLALSACADLPGTAAVEREIVTAAETGPADFAVYPVTRAFLPVVGDWPVTGERGYPWQGASGGARTQVLASGDELEVTIWDATDNSLLSAEGERAVQIEALTVQPDGTIFLPYVGETGVMGMTVQAARAHLQEEIATIVPSAQVQIRIMSGRTNSVDLVGGVAQPGSYPLPDRNYSVLNLIAQGGGVRQDLVNPQVRVMRGGHLLGISVARLYGNPGLDMLLRGGDQVIVEADDRYFLSLGAAGTQSQHAFPSDHVSALQAISIMGGVEGARGNPGGVLILREYPARAVRTGAGGPDQSRVVFTIDMTTTDGLFSARNFRVNSGDLLLVTESPVVRTQTIIGLIGSAFGIAAQTSRVTN